MVEVVVKSEIGEILGDDDLVEYVSSMLADSPEEADSGESIADFISSASGASEEDSQAAATKLFVALRANGFGSGGEASAKEIEEPLEAVTKLLENKVVIGEQEQLSSMTYGTAGDDGNFSTNGLKYAATEGVATTKPARKQRKTSKAAQKAERDAAEIETELENARVGAVLARARMGAFNGAIEAAKFTLPNPGGGQPLLEDAALTLVRGRRYGLIGRNGMGKSTLLRALAARRVGDVPENVTVHYVSQEVKLTSLSAAQTPGEHVVAADIERRVLNEEANALEAKAEAGTLDDAGQLRHSEVLDRLDFIGADSAERRVDELLTNLGFTDELRARPLKDLSGGWRVRTMLAAAIFARPDLLLLDEPTNHLSIAAVLWLARELSQGEVWKERTMVIVSHDRYFVDEVCGDVLHISGAAHRLTVSHGNYSEWAGRRAEQQKAYSKQVALRTAEAEKLREYADHGFKYGGSSGMMTKMGNKMRQAEKIEAEMKEMSFDLAALQEDVELPLNLLPGGILPGFLIQMRDVGFAYPGTPTLFRGCEIGITSSTRLVLLGENGNGKTTILKLLLGAIDPTEGDVVRASSARVALVNQHHADQLDLTLTPLEYMTESFPAPMGVPSYDHELKLRSHLASCGVPGGSRDGTVPDLQTVPGAALSGGQRSRVALAAVSWTKPHVLVLDEPTNNLDLESVGALAESVQNFEGAVVLVSHDQFFVNEVSTEAWVVGNHQVRRVESFEAYRRKELSKLGTM